MKKIEVLKRGEDGIDTVEQTVDVRRDQDAQRVEAGMNINLDHAQFYTRIVERTMYSTIAQILSEHQVVAMGSTSNTPDECSCGAKVKPHFGEGEIGLRRRRGFATHQRDVLVAAGVVEP